MVDRFGKNDDNFLNDPVMDRIERNTHSARVARMWNRAVAATCAIGAAVFVGTVLHSNFKEYKADVLTAAQKNSLEDKVLDAMSRGCGVDMLMRGSQEPVYYPAANLQKYFDSEIVPYIKDGTYTGMGNVYPEHTQRKSNTVVASSGSVYERTPSGVIFKGTIPTPKRNNLG